MILVLLKTLKEFGHDLGRLASLAKQWQRNEQADFRLSLANKALRISNPDRPLKSCETLPRIQKNFLFVFLPSVQLFGKARATTSKHVKARPDNREQCYKGVTLEYSLH